MRAYDASAVAVRQSRIRVWTVEYRAHNGATRRAFIVLPHEWGPKHNPPLPLVISPHGRGVDALQNLDFWGGLPGRGPFAVISPEGQGRVLGLYSWGYPGQIDDLARMAEIARARLPWLKINPNKVYAIGGSMGGQETLLLLGRHPGMLAGAAAFDSPTDMALRYRDFAKLPNGAGVQALARREIGGTPQSNPEAYSVRSPLSYAGPIARSGVPLQMWWSLNDQIVINQPEQSGKLYRQIRKLNAKAPVTPFVGFWRHTVEMRAAASLPLALERFGLLHLA